MTNELLRKQCSLIEYNNNHSLGESVVKDASNALSELVSQYGIVPVIYELSQLWSTDVAIPLFVQMNNRNLIAPQNDTPTSIKTIAVHSKRAYNGGAEVVMAQLLGLWIEMGYNVILLTSEEPNPLDYEYPDAVRRYIIPRTANMESRLSAIYSIYEKEHFDVYVNHDSFDREFIWDCILYKMLGVPIVQYLHVHFASSIWRNKGTLHQPDSFSLCDIILTLSETNARFYQLNGCNTYHIQNPIPKKLLEASSLPNLKSRHILFVGRISKEKHPMDALEIFKIVHDSISDAVLDVIGGENDELLRSLKEYSHDNNLDESIIFHGKKRYDEVIELYKNASCILFTPEMEGAPMVILEAKAFSLPVVMYELPYLTLVKDGLGILTSKFGDINSMAHHLISMLSDDNYLALKSEEARISFEHFKSYNQYNLWKNVFSICLGHIDDIADTDLYKASDIPPADRYILPIYQQAMEKGFDYSPNNTIDYLVGKRVLSIPRAIKKAISRK